MDRLDDPQKRASIGARRNPATQQAILDAAEALLREAGLAGFSIEGVARRARAGKPTIYRWWPSKTRLLLDVYQRLKTSLPSTNTGAIETDCMAFLEGLFAHWSGGSGAIFRSIVAEAQTDDAAAEALRTYAAERRQQTAEIFARAKARGELSADADPLIAAEFMAAFAWQRLLTGRLEISRDELQAMVRQLLRGVLNPSAS
jgi:AcrR family transcriptional regulator